MTDVLKRVRKSHVASSSPTVGSNLHRITKGLPSIQGAPGLARDHRFPYCPLTCRRRRGLLLRPAPHRISALPLKPYCGIGDNGPLTPCQRAFPVNSRRCSVSPGLERGSRQAVASCPWSRTAPSPPRSCRPRCDQFRCLSLPRGCPWQGYRGNHPGGCHFRSIWLQLCLPPKSDHLGLLVGPEVAPEI